jgi:hypothetical protein
VFCGSLLGAALTGDIEAVQDVAQAAADSTQKIGATDNFRPAIVQTVQSSGGIIIRVPPGKLTAAGHAPTVVNSST